MAGERQDFPEIAISLERLDPSRGGLERWTWEYSADLARRGFRVHIVACGRGAAQLPPGIAFHEAPDAALPFVRAKNIQRVLDRLGCPITHDMGAALRADIYHPHGGSSLAAGLYNLLRIPRWRQIRFWRERRYMEQLELQRIQLRNAGKILAVSRMTRDHLAAYDRVAPDKIVVIPNGPDVTAFAPTPGGSLRAELRAGFGCGVGDTLFLLLAHNLRLKNAEVAIRAFARFLEARKAGKLVVAGSRKPARAKALAHELGLARDVRFLPPVQEPRDLYRAADALIHPTWYDPCSLVALEAMACGLPVVTTRFNGASERIRDAENSYVIPHPSDEIALAARMIELSDPATRSRVGAAARSEAEAFSSSHQTAALIALYGEWRASARSR